MDKRIHKFENGDLVQLRPDANLMSGWRGIGYVVNVMPSRNPDFDSVAFIKLGHENPEDFAEALAYQLTHARFSSVKRLYG
jgi:hypothetical protein